MNSPPFFTNGMYARYSALLSLMVSVSRPGLLIGCLTIGFIQPVSNRSSAGSGSKGGLRLEQPFLRRQLHVQRRGLLEFQDSHPVEQAVKQSYLGSSGGRWQA